MKFKVIVNSNVYRDIQNQVDYYFKETKNHNLGKRFSKSVFNELKRLKKNPNQFQIRYDDIRCLLIPKFPFIAHFRIDAKNSSVEILAVINMKRNVL